MAITLFYFKVSPFVRSVLMGIEALGLDVNYVVVNPLNGETKKPEFVAMNPAHTVPTLKDGDFVLWESKAILTYLVSKYGKDDSFYPSDLQKRAEVNKMLYFDEGTLFSRFGKAYFPIAFGGQTTVDTKAADNLQEALGFLNTILEGKKFVIGDQVTVADWCLATTLGGLSEIGFDISSHKNVVAYYERLKQLPYFSKAQDGISDFANFFKSKMNQ